MTNTIEIVDQSTKVTATPVVTRVVPTTIDVSVQVPDETVTLSLDLLEATVIASSELVTVAIDNQVTNILTVGTQGPAGIAEDEMVYASRVDFLSDELLYRGEAVPGTADGGNLWRIRKIDIAASDGDVTTTWANGSASFNKVWDDRLSYTYT